MAWEILPARMMDSKSASGIGDASSVVTYGGILVNRKMYRPNGTSDASSRLVTERRRFSEADCLPNCSFDASVRVRLISNGKAKERRKGIRDGYTRLLLYT